MEYIRLGNSDISVSRFIFGCEPLGGTDWGELDFDSTKQAVRFALDQGVNLFDTADVYGLGLSETNLSEVLDSDRHGVHIISKFGINWDSKPRGGRARTFHDTSPRRVEQALDQSLKRLRVERISFYLIHWPDPATPLEETMAALVRCREKGKIGWIGVSNFSVEQIREAHAVAPLALVEMQYSLLDRKIEADIIHCCQELGIGLVGYGPLVQGLLTDGFSEERAFGTDDRRHRLPHFQRDALERNRPKRQLLNSLARKYAKTKAQTAIRWVLDAPGISAAIVGAKTTDHIRDSIEAVGWHLDPTDWQKTCQGVTTRDRDRRHPCRL